jgi:hypothetical protein
LKGLPAAIPQTRGSLDVLAWALMRRRFDADALALRDRYTRSMTSAMPWPTPMHMVHRP